MGAKGKATGTVNSPSDQDILDCLDYIQTELGYSVRYVVNLRKTAKGEAYLDTMLQLYYVNDNKAWIVRQRRFEWWNSHDRKYLSRLMIELHKCLHEWGDAAHVGLSG